MPKLTTKKQFDYWVKLRERQGYDSTTAYYMAMNIIIKKNIEILNDEIIKLKKQFLRRKKWTGKRQA